MPAVVYNEEQVTTGLMALVAWGGQATAAAGYLKTEKDLDIKAQTLSRWKVQHSDRYEDMREKYSAKLEESLARELREVAMYATQVQRLALERAHQKLMGNSDNDPGRTAAHTAKVVQTSTDKLMVLLGRPTQITERRDEAAVKAAVRGLVAKGILSLPEGFVDDEPDTTTNGAVQGRAEDAR